MDLGFAEDANAGMPVQRMNSRGMSGVAQASQEFAKGRKADLSVDLFGLGDLMGPPSGPKTKRAPTTKDPSPRSTKRQKASPKGSPGRSPGSRGKGQEKAALAALEASTPTIDGRDPWVNRNVKLKRGKYEGRVAFVLGKTEKKYQVQVEGVPYQLEFYSTMFVLPENYKPPKGESQLLESAHSTSGFTLSDLVRCTLLQVARRRSKRRWLCS